MATMMMSFGAKITSFLSCATTTTTNRSNRRRAQTGNGPPVAETRNNRGNSNRLEIGRKKPERIRKCAYIQKLETPKEFHYWRMLPPEIQGIIIDMLDFKTTLSLADCSRENAELVDRSFVKIHTLSITTTKTHGICSLRLLNSPKFYKKQFNGLAGIELMWKWVTRFIARGRHCLLTLELKLINISQLSNLVLHQKTKVFHVLCTTGLTEYFIPKNLYFKTLESWKPIPLDFIFFPKLRFAKELLIIGKSDYLASMIFNPPGENAFIEVIAETGSVLDMMTEFRAKSEEKKRFEVLAFRYRNEKKVIEPRNAFSRNCELLNKLLQQDESIKSRRGLHKVVTAADDMFTSEIENGRHGRYNQVY